MLAGLIAFAMSVSAAGLIFCSWRQSNSRLAAAGWLSAFGSALVWCRALGPEFGVTYAIIIFVCLIWAEVAFAMETRRLPVESARRPFQKMHWPRMQDCIRHGILFLLSVPAIGVIAMMLSVALVLYLPWTMQNKVAVAIFLYPLLWGALSAWICAQSKLIKPMLVSAGLLAVSSLILMIRI